MAFKVQSKRSAPIGRCIYCGSDGGNDGLNEEHVVPYSLAGPLILTEASCRSCSGKINFVEGHCGRKMFHIRRTKQKYPTRRPKERPSNLPLTTTINGKNEVVATPIENYPDTLVMPQFQPPGVLRGNGPTTSWDNMSAIGIAEKPSSIKGVDSVELDISFSPRVFTRLLAKIGHCLAVLRYGLDGFRPLLLKHILEDDPFAPHWIGSKAEIDPADPNSEHDLSMHTVKSDQGEKVIVASIRLFAYQRTPTFTVVVGIALGEPRAPSDML